jgi:hypothetical protein
MPRKPWLTRLMYSHRYANVALVDRDGIDCKTHQLENVVDCKPYSGNPMKE